MCANHWGNSDATVACRQLGHSATGAKALKSTFYWHYRRIYLNYAHCRGSETRLIDCISVVFIAYGFLCQDARVNCFPRSSKLLGEL